MLYPCGFSDGQSTAIAGRFTPGALRSASIDSAISAPVLPPEMTTGDLPAFTASSALHMLVPWALRSTLEGLSSIATTLAAWRTSERSASGVPGRIDCAICSPSPWTM